jgi:hypothetical protein
MEPMLLEASIRRHCARRSVDRPLAVFRFETRAPDQRSLWLIWGLSGVSVYSKADGMMKSGVLRFLASVSTGGTLRSPGPEDFSSPDE